MSGPEADTDAILSACLASAGAAASHLTTAADAWGEGADPAPALGHADRALGRAKAQAEALRTALSGHARLARLALEAVARGSVAHAAAAALPPAAPTPIDPDEAEDVEEADREAAELAHRTLGAFRRAIELAATSRPTP